MGFQLNDFAAKRPVAYHVTRRENLPSIRASRTLYSAGKLLTLGGRDDLLRAQRRGSVTLQVGEHPAIVRDQDRLVAASLDLADGISLPDYIAYLNRWIFFWPGDWQSPSSRTKDIAAATDDVAVIRISVASLLSHNAGMTPAFSQVNSGAARHHSGKAAKRDLNVHRRAGIFRQKATDVVEMVLEEAALLPDNAEVAQSIFGPWSVL